MKRTVVYRSIEAGLAFALLLVLAAGIVSAQQPQVRPPASVAELRLSYAPVVQRVAPAVVNVYAQRTVRETHPFLDDPFFRRFFGPDFGVPRERVQQSLGSGVIVDPAGFVVTNHHVIEGAEAIRIAFADKREFDANVVLRDQRSDLAVLRIKDPKERFPAIEFSDSDAIEVGDIVLAIGNPFGVGQTVTQGIVSAAARTVAGVADHQFFIQTDAAINPGNSGGALVDMTGRLVGINTAIYSRTGGSLGIGFAVPANMVRVVVDSARVGSSAVLRPWLGAQLQAVTPEIAENLGLKRPAGALVANVHPDGPAALAKLAPGDVIVAIDGRAVEDPSDFEYRFATKPLGSKAVLSVERQGRLRDVAVPLATAPEAPREEVVIRSRSPFQGVKAANLSPALAEELQLGAAAEGVVIVEVAEGSAANLLGFRAGDIVVAVNNQRIAKSSDLERIAAQPAPQWNITIQRGGRQINVTFRG